MRTTTSSGLVRRWLGPARRAIWTGFDQALSSLSNVIISIAVARGAGADGLGAFALAFSIYQVLLGFERQLISEPYLSLPPEKLEGDTSRLVITSAVMMVTPVSALTVMTGALLSQPSVVILGVGLIPLLLQDVVRYVAFRRKRPKTAVLSDGVWVTCSIAAWPLVISGGVRSGITWWAVGAAAAAAAGALPLSLRWGGIRRAYEWWREHARAFGGFLALAAVAHTAGTQAVTFGFGAVLGLTQLGVFRGAQIIFGPALLLTTAAGFFLVPTLTDRPRSLSHGEGAAMAASSLAGMTAIVTIITITREPLVGLLFAGSVVPPLGVMLPFAIHVVFIGGAWAYAVLLRVDRAGRSIAGAYGAVFLVGAAAAVAMASSVGLVAGVWVLTGQAFALMIWLGAAWHRRRGATRRVPVVTRTESNR